MVIPTIDNKVGMGEYMKITHLIEDILFINIKLYIYILPQKYQKVSKN